MALLLYGVAKPAHGFACDFKGVAELHVSSFERAGLTVFFSGSATADPWLRSRLRDCAIQFHDVLSHLFQQCAVIPFRFPTIIENDEMLAEHMDQRAADYNSWLQKFQGKAQMDVRVIASAAHITPSSGGEFLRARQEQRRELDAFAANTEARCREVVEQWRRRALANGFRAAALLDRGRVEDFRQALAGMSVPPGFQVRVSGPWPVAEFLESANEH